jgi:hypothetical protein
LTFVFDGSRDRHIVKGQVSSPFVSRSKDKDRERSTKASNTTEDYRIQLEAEDVKRVVRGQEAKRGRDTSDQ